MTHQSIKAIFFDRDGVLIDDSHLLTDLSKAVPTANIAQCLKDLKSLGIKLFVVTNQTVVSRGLLTLEKTLELNEQILELVSGQSPHYFDEVYVCPHHPQAQVPEFKVHCTCRKPQPGMLLKALEKYDLNPKQCLMLGDRVSDMAAANLAKCHSILIKGKYSQSEPIKIHLDIDDSLYIPHYTFGSVKEFTEQFLKGALEFS